MHRNSIKLKILFTRLRLQFVIYWWKCKKCVSRVQMQNREIVMFFSLRVSQISKSRTNIDLWEGVQISVLCSFSKSHFYFVYNSNVEALLDLNLSVQGCSRWWEATSSLGPLVWAQWSQEQEQIMEIIRMLIRIYQNLTLVSLHFSLCPYFPISFHPYFEIQIQNPRESSPNRKMITVRIA